MTRARLERLAMALLARDWFSISVSGRACCGLSSVFGSEQESAPRSAGDGRMMQVRSDHVSVEASGDIIGLPSCGGDTPPGVTTMA